MLLPAQKLINAHGGAFAVSHAVNNQARAKNAIAAGKDARDGGHQVAAVHGNQPARRQFDVAFFTHKIQIWSLTNGHDHRVAFHKRFASRSKLGTESAVFIEHAAGAHSFQSGDAAILADDLVRSEASVDDHTFGFSFFHFFQRGRNFVAPLDAHNVNFTCTQAQRGKRYVHHLMGSYRTDVLGPFFCRDFVLADHFTRGRTGDVHGHVTAADHNNFFADGELIAQVHVQQKINAFIDAIQIDAGNGKIATAMRAHRDEHGIKALRAEFFDGKIFAGALVQFEGDIAGFQDLSYLGFNHVARQAIFGNSKIEHAARDGRGLKDGDGISHQGQIVRGRETNRTGADNCNLVWKSGLFLDR